VAIRRKECEMKTKVRMVVAVIAYFLTAPSARCYDDELATSTAVEDRMIEIESSPIDSDKWDGLYRRFPGIDEAFELAVSKKLGFAYRKVGNSGYSDFLLGKVREANGRIHLDAVSGDVSDIRTFKDLVVARTCTHSFLIPEGRIHGFFLDFSKSEKNTIREYFSRVTENPVDPGRILVDKQFDVLRNLPIIRCTISSIERVTGNNGELILGLDKGRSSGILKGMIFSLSDSSRQSGEIRWEVQVREVGDKVSRAIVLPSTEQFTPIIGDELETSTFPW
jgi:hypothetical protein